MEPKPHPLWANETAREMLADLERAETIDEWNLCLGDLVALLVGMAAPRPSSDWPEWERRNQLLRKKIKEGFKPPRRRGRPPVTALQALEDIHQIRMAGEGATFRDAVLRLRFAAGGTITKAAASKRVLNAERVGGFRLPRSERGGPQLPRKPRRCRNPAV